MPETNDDDKEILAERLKPAPIQLPKSELTKEVVQQNSTPKKITPHVVQHQKAPGFPDILQRKDKSPQNQSKQEQPSNSTSLIQKLFSSQPFDKARESEFYQTTGIQRIKYIKPATLIIAIAGVIAGTLSISFSVQRILNNEVPIKKTEVNVLVTQINVA
jgi:hypothetical protein